MEATADVGTSGRRHNVKKSLDLLGDMFVSPSVHRPGSRSSQQPSATPYRHSSYTPVANASTSQFGSSNMGLFSPGRAPSEASSNKAIFGSTMMSNAHRASFLTQNQTMQDVTMLNTTLLLEDNAELSACRDIFTEFAKSLKSGQHEIFEPVHRYHNICRETIAPLQKLTKEAVPSQNKLSRTVGLMTVLEHEMDTWSLISSLYQDRFAKQFEEENMSIDTYRPSEKKLTDMLFEEDQMLRQAQLVVDWLEHIAERYLEDLYNKVEFSMDKRGSWENTLHLLQAKKSGIQPGKLRNVVTQLDPDAPLRQGRHLVDLDQDDDALLLKYVFFCIRAGRLDEATKVCSKVGQLWRAAALEGWRLYHDPNVEQIGSGGSLQMVVGNPYRDLWKRSCWKISENERLPLYERGIYAVLSGNLKHILPCCSSWSDYIWAYFRVLVDQLVENNIHKSFVGSRPLLDLPNSYADKSLTAESIFAEVAASCDEKIQKEASYRFNLIQKYIILNDVDSLIEDVHSWCRDDSNHLHPHMIRFMAHLVLFLRSLDVSIKEDMCNSILEEYIKLLIQERHVDLVAMYVSSVPEGLQLELYSKFLEGIFGTEERKHCLDLAEEAGLDVPLITKLVVENIRNANLPDSTSNADHQLEAVTSEEDLVKIGAIEWLTFDPEQRSEALRQANAMMRVFLGARKLSACHEAACALPTDTIDIIMKSWQRKAGNTQLPAEDANAIREFLCIQSYLEAQESFSRWFEHFHHAKPMKPDTGIGGNFTERVAIEHKQREYENELTNWQQSLMHQTEVTKKKIYNVLLFIDGGWMVDQRPDDQPDENRSRQMSQLRQLCLPTLCLLLHKVLHTTEQYKECLQLADIIASDHYKLNQVFQPEELQQLLQRLADSSVALLDSGLNPLGYPLS